MQCCQMLLMYSYSGNDHCADLYGCIHSCQSALGTGSDHASRCACSKNAGDRSGVAAQLIAGTDIGFANLFHT